MIGFYLTINKSANSDIKLSSSQYESPIDSDTFRQQGLYIFNHDHPQTVQSSGYTIFNIGTLIYKNEWRKKALELIICDLNNGKTIQEIMPNTRGQFCLIVHTAGNVFVTTDKLGSFPVYKFEDNDTIQISNIFLPLAKRNNVSVDYQAFAEYLSFNYCFDCTFFNEIVLLDRGTIYQFDPDMKIQRYDDFLSGIAFNKYNNLDEIFRLVKETLENNLSFLSSNDKIFVDLTGGFDTRTIVTILHGMNIDFDVGICGEQIQGELGIAEQVAETLQVKHHSNIKITDVNAFRRIVNKHFEIGNFVPILYHSSELLNYYEHIKRDFDIHITGFAGSQLFDQFLPRLSFFSSRLKHKALFEKTFRFNDIINDNLLTKTLYRENLAKKITKLLEEIGSDVHDEVACIFPLSTFNKYYHGTLAGTHNTLMPFYCPYLESNIVRVMGETSYKLKDDRTIQRALLTKLNQPVSLIMTSHGYNANIGSKRTKSTLRRFKKFAKALARQMIYDLGFPIKIMRLVENFSRKVKPPTRLEEIQRSFWIDEVEKDWSDNMTIFEVVDRNKLNKYLANESYNPKLKAKIIYLNRIIEKCRPKL